MKKLVSVFLMLLFAITISAQSTITLQLPEIPSPGATITVPLTVTQIDAGILAFQVYVQYDPAVLQYVSVAFNNPQFPAIEWFSGNLAGEWGGNWFGVDFLPEFVTPPAVLCEVTFTYLGGDTELIWGLAKGGAPIKGQTLFFDDAFNEFVHTFVNGCVAGSCGGGPVLTTWTGAVSNDWFNAGNWDNGVPSATVNAYVPAGLPNDPYINNGVAETLDLGIAFGAMVWVGPVSGNGLTTHGMLGNNGVLYLDGTIPGGYSGSYIDLGGMSGTGTFEFFLNVGQPVTPPDDPSGWHYLSSPVDGFDSDQMWDYFVNFWNEPTSMWMNHTGNPAIPCDPAPNVGMGPMDSWSVKYDQVWPGPNNCPGGTGDIVEFFGTMTPLTVHTGLYAKPATFTPGAYAGWNLFGNPYPSSIDPALILWDPNANQSIYYWDGFANTYVSWAGGVGSVIPPAIGYFVNFTGSGIMSLAGTERIHGPDWFWKSGIENLLKLQATAQGQEKGDVTYIRFLEEATASFDKVWDAYKLMSKVPGVPQIYTPAGEDILSINAQPQADVVPMNFECVTSGTFTIEALETSEFAIVILEDKFTGQTTDLLAGSYTFDHIAGSNPDRFNVHFKSLGIGDNLASQVSIWSADQKIFVRASETQTGQIAVYNMMGQEVLRTDMHPGLNTLAMNDVNTYYVVKVYTHDSAVTGKVFIR